ncbi:MAG: hypothetical protein KC431_22345 [Myxococcales bacterium]|nr:hypothetical protein [Myxococcales bacterium]
MSSLEDASNLEPELEELFLRWVPDMTSRWASASGQDIAAIERLAGGEIPRCYRWLLRRLGRGWAELGYGSLDFSARTIVDGHSRGLFPPCEGMMCIANDTAEWQPQLRYYDLAHPAKDDAPVFAGWPDEGGLSSEFQTLRELIGAAVFKNHRLQMLPVRCEGVFVDEDKGDVLDVLIPLFEELGFQPPIPGGPLSLLYDNGMVAFSSYRRPHRLMVHLVPFVLGGPSMSALRKVLGSVSTSTHLVIKRLSWNSP